MKKENYLESNKTQLEEKLKENKIKLLQLRGDVANRKTKNVHEMQAIRKDNARILFALGLKNRAEKQEMIVAENENSSTGGKK